MMGDKMLHRKLPSAYAKICGGRGYPQIIGHINFFQGQDGLVIEAEVFGLPNSDSGFFGFHIHGEGDCRGEGFPNTGAHFNPGGTHHPRHAGDLPPLLSDHGKAYMKVYTDRFHIGEIIGRSVIIHSAPDDFRSQPAGNSGEKIACGVIRDLRHLR